jgi:hypothetical protein
MLIYLGVALILRVPEVKYFVGVFKRVLMKKVLPLPPAREQEPISPTTTDTQEQ